MLPSLTWVSLDRCGSFLTASYALVDQIDALRQAFRYVKQRHPFDIDAIVVMPDHLHCILTLPEGDTDFSIRWNLLKGQFSRSIEKGERISASRVSKRERGIWQRRFWTHLITDQEDFNRHVDYIHWNPVKHGWSKQAADLPRGHKGLIQVFIIT